METFRQKMKSMVLAFALLMVLGFSGCMQENDPNEISVSTQSLSFDRNADFAYVTLNSNTEWDVSSDQQWCRTSTSHGRFSQPVQIFVEANDSGVSRTAIIRFKTSSPKHVYASIIVTQSDKEDETNND